MRYLLLFACPAVGYVLLGVNLRALSRGRKALTAATEFTYALINFATIRRVAEASTLLEALAFAAGATLGTLASLYLTQHWDE